MGRSLNELSPRFFSTAAALLARLAEAKIPVLITATGRTEKEHQKNLRAGTSRVKRSKHQGNDYHSAGCPNVATKKTKRCSPECAYHKSTAIDLAPYSVYHHRGRKQINWNAGPGPHRVKEPWKTMGRIGEKLGLRWGGRWKRPFDPGHFELKARG